MLKDLFQICVSKILFSLQLNGDVKREDIQIILLPFSEAIAFTQLAHSFLIRLLLPLVCSKSAPRPGQHFLFLVFHLLAATICSNSVFKHFSCCHFDSNTSSNSRKKCTRLMDLSPSDIPLQKLENSIPRPNACL